MRYVKDVLSNKRDCNLARRTSLTNVFNLKVTVIETSIMHKSTVMPSLNAIA